MGPVFALLILAAVVIGVVAVVRRVMGKREGEPSDGGDVIAYLLMALAVGVTAFSLAELGQAAFPGDSFVLDTSQLVATSLAGLVVAGPIAIILWRRQAHRRTLFPASGGWTVYLALVEAVFLTAAVLAAYSVLNWLIGDGPSPTWTDLIIFGGVVVFHEWAARRSPPGSDSADLPRVVGSAIGLVTTSIGLGGTLYWLFERLYSTMAPTVAGGELGSSIALLIVGAPIWWHRWWRSWPTEPGTPRKAWLPLVSVIGLATAIGSAGVIVVEVFLYLFADTDPAGSHFSFLPEVLAVGVVGVAIWWVHRFRLGSERDNSVRSYEYAMAALGLAVSVGSATALASIAFAGDAIIEPSSDDVAAVATALVIGLGVWYWFWSKASRAPRELEAAAGPRRVYLIGMAIVTGLTAAGALIATLVVVFQRLLGTSEGDFVVQASLFVFAGLATWHLLRVNAHDRDLIVSEEIITPFGVTIICSHPGMLAAKFPKAAKLRIVYRADEAGLVSDAMADEIVAAVANRPALVWVDEDGFRIATAR